MQDIREKTLLHKINQFIERKSRKYPELHMDERWDEYEYTPDTRDFSKAQKH